MVIYEYIQYQENILPSHKTPLNPSRYGPNKGWITLGIEQTNLGKKKYMESTFSKCIYLEMSQSQNRREISLNIYHIQL